MISDTLHDALREIDRYLNEFDCYNNAALRAHVLRTVDEMGTLMARLDDPLPITEEEARERWERIKGASFSTLL